MNLKELRAKYGKVADRLGELVAISERTAEQEDELDQVLKEFNDLGEQVVRAANIDEAVKRSAKLTESRGRIGSEEGITEDIVPGENKPDRRSLGQRFAESDELKDFVENGGKRSDKFDVGSFYHRHTMQHESGMTPEEVRAIIQTGTLPAEYIQPTIVPGIFRGTDLEGTVRDVLVNGTTNSDAITFFRELVFTNNAAAVAQATATTGATGLKPESAITFEQATAPVVTVAHWIPITRQTLADAAQMRTYVEQRLLDGLRLEESDQLLNGDGTGANMTGLLVQTGTQALDAAYFTANAVNDAGTDNENFNRLARAQRLIRTVGRARANFVVLNPINSETFRTSTDGNRQYFGAGPFSAIGTPPLWGMRVVEDENIAANLALVGDGRMAAVWDREQANILVDTINDQFVRNMLTILAEERLALTTFRPAAFAKVTLVA